MKRGMMRALDVAAALAALVVLSPLLIAIALVRPGSAACAWRAAAAAISAC